MLLSRNLRARARSLSAAAALLATLSQPLTAQTPAPTAAETSSAPAATEAADEAALPELAPAAFASPASDWQRIEDQAGWLTSSSRTPIIQSLDQYAARSGISIYLATAPAGQGPHTLVEGRKRLEGEFQNGSVIIYVLSSDPRTPLLYDGSEKFQERLGRENYFLMNAAIREAVRVEETPAKRPNVLLTTLAQELKKALAKGPSAAETALAEAAPESADVAAAVPATEAPAEEAEPGAGAGTVGADGTTAVPGETALAAAAEAIPVTPAETAVTAAAAPGVVATATPAPGELVAATPSPSRRYLWVTLACLGALVIVGGGAWFLLNLYRPVELTPKAATRIREERRREAIVRKRLSHERGGVGAVLNNVKDALHSAKREGEAAPANRRGGSPAQRRTEAASATSQEAEGRAAAAAAVPGKRTPGETFEQRLWRCFGDYSRMHYGRRPEAFTPEQVAEAQQHELFSVLDEYLTYFKWLGGQAHSRGDKKAAREADEHYQFLYGSATLLRRCAPTLRNHLMPGLEAFLKQSAEAGLIPGVTKQRRPAGV